MSEWSPTQIMLARMDEKITYLRDRLYKRKLAGKVDEKTEPLQTELKQLIGERDSKLKQLRKERIDKLKELREKDRPYESTLLNMTVDFKGSVGDAQAYMKEKGYIPMKVYSYREKVWYASHPDKIMKEMSIQDWPITRSMKKQQEDNAKAYGFAGKSIRKVKKSTRKVKKSPRKTGKSPRKVKKSPRKVKKSNKKNRRSTRK
uniref:Uncharacterized protein n=1 Tax=viral metagenome TaxID=1070528 RepID=A0A6C0KF71_9ZZZZ